MKIFGTAALIGLGVFAGLIYVNGVEISNLQAFFLICVFIVIFSFTMPRQEDAANILACSNKGVALASSFIIGGTGLANLYYLYNQSMNQTVFTVITIADYIPAVLTLLASYSLVNITLLIKNGNAKNSPHLCTPLIWITFELILVFQKVSANPILIEYILEFFVLSSCTVLLLQFAKTFCTTDRKIYFKASALMTSFFLFAYYVVLISGRHEILIDFQTVRFLILTTSIVLYMAPFYNKKH